MDAAGPAAVEPPPVGEQGRDFDAFARRERGPLVAFAWSLTGDRAAAEDLVQEALAAAWSRWDEVSG
ncbi:MAG TPA: sigma factor, partial [Acidimicrobiales bacterium]|nr:sigma factor [Acidimicrobiales bacterium]